MRGVWGARRAISAERGDLLKIGRWARRQTSYGRRSTRKFEKLPQRVSSLSTSSTTSSLPASSLA